MNRFGLEHMFSSKYVARAHHFLTETIELQPVSLAVEVSVPCGQPDPSTFNFDLWTAELLVKSHLSQQLMVETVCVSSGIVHIMEYH